MPAPEMYDLRRVQRDAAARPPRTRNRARRAARPGPRSPGPDAAATVPGVRRPAPRPETSTRCHEFPACRPCARSVRSGSSTDWGAPAGARRGDPAVYFSPCWAIWRSRQRRYGFALHVERYQRRRLGDAIDRHVHPGTRHVDARVIRRLPDFRRDDRRGIAQDARTRRGGSRWPVAISHTRSGAAPVRSCWAVLPFCFAPSLLSDQR